MNIESIINLITDNEKIINSTEFIESILNMHNNLLRFDSLNRILIQLQYPDAFDLKSFEEWSMCGRSVVKGSKQIWVISPQYEHKYVYADNESKEADTHDLSITEKNKAIELNIIKRQSSIKDIKVLAVYDIKVTKKDTEQNFEVGKPVLNQVEVLRLFKETTGCRTDRCDDFFYSVSENSLFIPIVEYREFATMIAQAFTKYYLEITDTQNCDLDILEEYTRYSITTLLRGNASKIKRTCSGTQELMQIVSIVDSIIEKLVIKMEYSGQIDTKSGAVQNIDVLKKAEVVLNLFDAVSTNRKINGI